MTLMTMISTATPSETPSTEIKVMNETNVLLGRRYRSASSSSNGKPDMGRRLDSLAASVNEGAGLQNNPCDDPQLAASCSMSGTRKATTIDPQVRIGHVHLKVSNLQRALDFYCGVLG